MNKIIVPTEFSPTAAGALRYAYFLAEATGFDLEIIHVHDGYGHLEGSRVKKGDMEARMAAQRSIDQFIRFNAPTVAAAAALAMPRSHKRFATILEAAEKQMNLRSLPSYSVNEISTPYP